jgi:hypothetical protein
MIASAWQGLVSPATAAAVEAAGAERIDVHRPRCAERGPPPPGDVSGSLCALPSQSFMVRSFARPLQFQPASIIPFD